MKRLPHLPKSNPKPTTSKPRPQSKLVPISDSSSPLTTVTPPKNRKKRLTKTKQREKSTPRLAKIVDTSSNDDEDSGISLTRVDRRFVARPATTSLVASNVAKKRMERKKDDMELFAKDLVEEIIQHSLSEVLHEERHLMLLESRNV